MGEENNDNIDLDEDESISKTVFYDAIASGVSREKSLELAKKAGRRRYNSIPYKLKRILIPIILGLVIALIGVLNERALLFIHSL